MRERPTIMSGFTLIELIITVTVIAILSAVAVPLYTDQQRKGYRAEALAALTRIAQKEERWMTQFGAYTNNLLDLNEPATTENNKYNISLTYGANNRTFIVTATATGQQANDDKCVTFTLLHTGKKTATNSNNALSPACWPK